MDTWILYTLLVLLAGGIAMAVFFLLRRKTWDKKEQFDATRDLFI